MQNSSPIRTLGTAPDAKPSFLLVDVTRITESESDSHDIDKHFSLLTTMPARRKTRKSATSKKAPSKKAASKKAPPARSPTPESEPEPETEPKTADDSDEEDAAPARKRRRTANGEEEADDEMEEDDDVKEGDDDDKEEGESEVEEEEEDELEEEVKEQPDYLVVSSGEDSTGEYHSSYKFWPKNPNDSGEANTHRIGRNFAARKRSYPMYVVLSAYSLY